MRVLLQWDGGGVRTSGIKGGGDPRLARIGGVAIRQVKKKVADTQRIACRDTAISSIQHSDTSGLYRGAANPSNWKLRAGGPFGCPQQALRQSRETSDSMIRLDAADFLPCGTDFMAPGF
jgi:hypothetical protein